ncbi:XRE family transcriptional regulator [Longimycelium tulufanense]|uniref:XRE family transcriptional regulator n=1 Tax=Longimycelium tulufanense TaxID=907463 RepID=A0A8J3CHB7_9PSEU|nr:helix-turn-helix transcriptional regulator [Longimycelium tulufanense]GGM61249.1 XRE family transcriptional regulator [Longimycelium tulufanense]
MGLNLALFWERPDIRDALAARDVGTVFRALAAAGLPQRDIATLTGVAQSSVSEIVTGTRKVQAYDLLDRIATGLGIPRAYMGLAYSPGCGPCPQDEEDEDVKRRRFLAHAGRIVLGVAVFGEVDASFQPRIPCAPVPDRVGMADVQQIEAATARLHSLAGQHGGELVLPALRAQGAWAEQLLWASTSDPVRRALLGSLARLQEKTAEAAFDAGSRDTARDHLLKGMEHAKAGEHPALQAHLLYTAGRVETHYGAPDAALQLYQLAHVPAMGARMPLLLALLEINQARAYAQLHARDAALRAIDNAREHFERATPDNTPRWMRFGLPQLAVAEGLAWAHLGNEDRAIIALRACLSSKNQTNVRRNSIDLTELAAAHLRNGDIGEGSRLGMKALDLAGTLRSQRTRDRLVPLQRAALRSGRAAKDLAERVGLARQRPA